MSESTCPTAAPALGCDLCMVRERSICSVLGPEVFAQVSKTMARHAIPKGRAIVTEGEPADHLYTVVQGSFRLLKYLEDGRRQITGFVFPGDFVGVQATSASVYTAEALEDSRVCRFAHGFLDRVSADYPRVKDHLIANGQTEVHKAQEHIVLLGKKTAEERVQSFLDFMATKAGRTGPDGATEIALAMPRQDIADYLGLRLETLSRCLSALKKQGRIVALSRHSVTLAPETAPRAVAAV